MFAYSSLPALYKDNLSGIKQGAGTACFEFYHASAASMIFASSLWPE
jgi:hypothetical protein